jgi:imidazolonepropionase-like amidohydrolase
VRLLRFMLLTGLGTVFPVALTQAGTPADHQALVFIGVNVIPMNSDGVLRDQTVIVEGNRFVRIGSRALVALPANARHIQAAGQYMLPGLADMHAHITASEDEATNPDLLLYLASGVTTLRNMVGSPAHLDLKKRLNDGELTGTRLFTVSPLLEGEDAVWSFAIQVVDPADAAAKVAEFAEAGYDAVKVYHTLSPEVYESVIEAAQRHHLPVVGHIPFGIGIERALRAGHKSVEHLRGYDIDGVPADVLAVDGGRSPRRFASWLGMSDARMEELAQATVAAGAWNCPTFVVNDMLANLEQFAAAAGHPMSRYLPPPVRERLSSNPLAPLFSPEAREMLAKAKPRQLEFLKALHDAGANLLIGTDSMVHSLVPGFTVIDEIANFVQAGLTEQEAIAAATVEPARYLGTLNSSGTIEPGKLADLILVDGNPLEDIDNLRKIAGVAIGGRWSSQSDLQQELEKMAESWNDNAEPAAATPSRPVEEQPRHRSRR